MLSRGLKPEHKLLDISCGSLRGGVKFVRYLNAGNYFGTDLNASLLQAGYDIEIANEGLLEELPRSNLITDEKFDFSWAAQPFRPRQSWPINGHLSGHSSSIAADPHRPDAGATS